MKVMGQLAMVMNLDKCIGCHTCSVTCKQAWTNRAGTEYVWFNNVETRPGQGYPRTYQDQKKWQGGWELNSRGSAQAEGRRAAAQASDDLREPADAVHPGLLRALDVRLRPAVLRPPATEDTPVARPKSLISGEPTKITWSANWDDDLGGGPELTKADPVLRKVSDQVKLEFERAFMFYLPRICEHCLNPSCVASCPSGAMYKRSEDGIVLVDQDRCRGWRMCVTGCPYKKVYFNHRTGKAEKCTFCFPRVEVGIPTVCSETCVGRLRYIGLILYDADRVAEAARTPDEKDLYEAQKSVLLDPNDPEVIAGARASGIPEDWLEAAQSSPIHQLIFEYGVALPLHPEYRTMPMVWYIPPLSPVVDVLSETGHDGEEVSNLFGAIESLRIPIGYLAELFTAGDPAPVRLVLRRLAAMRSYMRQAQPRPGARREHRRGGRHDRRPDRVHAPAAGPGPLRRAVRHPQGARRAGRRPGGARHRVQPRLRGRPRHGRAVRRGVRHARADRGRELPRAARAAERGRAGAERGPARPGQPLELGRQGHPRGPVPPRRDKEGQ
ncbi:nitrate reductase subunit beta [Nonomuraea ferruginea]